MLFSTNLKQVNLRPFLLFVIFSFLFTFGSTSKLQAQVTIDIIILSGYSSHGGDLISVNPNPVVNNAQVQHEEELQLQTLTILSQNGSVIAVLDLTQSSTFEVSLPAELTSWVFQTDAGVISKQVLISGS